MASASQIASHHAFPNPPSGDEVESISSSQSSSENPVVPAPRAVARKRVREAIEDEERAVPDLDEIFTNFDTPVEDRIVLCRTYASYLANRVRISKGKK